MHNKNNIELTRIIFENKPSTKTPVNANNLNSLQNNIDELCQSIQDEMRFADETNATNIENNSKAIEGLKGNKIYSTEEIDTGEVWIDNRHIYKRTFDIGVLDNNDNVKLFTFDGDYYDVIKKESTIHSGGTGQTPLPIINPVDDITLADQVETNKSQKKLQIYLRRKNPNHYSGWSYIVTVYYTKATDGVS